MNEKVSVNLIIFPSSLERGKSFELIMERINLIMVRINDIVFFFELVYSNIR